MTVTESTEVVRFYETDGHFYDDEEPASEAAERASRMAERGCVIGSARWTTTAVRLTGGAYVLVSEAQPTGDVSDTWCGQVRTERGDRLRWSHGKRGLTLTLMQGSRRVMVIGDVRWVEGQ